MSRWMLAALLALGSAAPAYAQTSATTMTVKDGNAAPQRLRADVAGDGSLATHTVVETSGSAVSAGNPLSVQVITSPATVLGAGNASIGAVTTLPSTRTLIPLDISTVTTGGTAVTALAGSHRTAGGWISNPATATNNLGINEIGTASGTTSAGSTTFIAPGQTYTLAPSANAVSVISSDSAHPFSGQGLQ